MVGRRAGEARGSTLWCEQGAVRQPLPSLCSVPLESGQERWALLAQIP